MKNVLLKSCTEQIVTHLCRVDSSTSSLWTSSFLILFFIITMFAGISELNANSTDPDQTSISVVISVYTVCQCPFYGMLGLNGLKCMNDSFYLEVIFLN